MPKQSEQILEEQLITQLQKLGYALVPVPDEKALLANFKTQLEKHNNIRLSSSEFERVMNIVSKGSVFEKAHRLRQKQHIYRDNGDNLYFEFINMVHWCQNQYQVAHQVSMEGRYRNRYDVTLLINGLPLVQIELKRRGLEMKEAFNQTNRYQGHSYGAGAALFQYIQIFVISNGVNTKYFANNRRQSFKQTFYWADKENKRLTNVLNGFTDAFLEPCHISKMICKYIVLHESDKTLMVLRPYQYYAVEAIIDRVRHSNRNGYIWHTTGSGKTLTSFKASQIIMEEPTVKRVVFVVDRKDLDYQTIKEFEAFQEGSVDATDDTQDLVKQFLGTFKDKKGVPKNSKLIVTTIQKLNTAISKADFRRSLDKIRDEKMVFIFDECHRSQFGETHGRIRNYFTHAQLFGFTGTPIFETNAVKNGLGKRTTAELFEECLHKYVITDAIRDENVLKFAVEYVGRYKQKDTANEIDIDVEAIDTEELLQSEMRMNKIVDYLIAHHGRKTYNKTFTSMFCVDSIGSLVKYYDILQRRKEAGEHDLRVATIFSYAPNADEVEDESQFEPEYAMAAEESATYGHTQRDKLEQYIGDYNKMFSASYSTKDSKSFYNYYKDISKQVKGRNVDVLLVVNMFLTGFDSKWLNTLFVDKNLKYHGLIQAYSRTNRTLDEKKSQGNIVVFRNLKQNTEDAIALFSNKDAKETIIVPPYDAKVVEFREAFTGLMKIAPSVNSVNLMQTEEDELRFVMAFRQIIRLKNALTTYADFDWSDLPMSEQSFEDYVSKYLDLRDKVKAEQAKEKVSILNDVDFEVELIHQDDINVAYILKLLAGLNNGPKSQQAIRKNHIIDLLNKQVELRSKRELIQLFIESNMPFITDPDDIPEAFDAFWGEQQAKAFRQLVAVENLNERATEALVEDSIFSGREILRDEAIALIDGDKPTLLQRRPTAERIIQKIRDFVGVFVEGMS